MSDYSAMVVRCGAYDPGEKAHDYVGEDGKCVVCCLRGRVAELEAALGLAVAALSYPENGVHFCRHCRAGTHNEWQHSRACWYAERVRRVDVARAALAGAEKAGR